MIEPRIIPLDIYSLDIAVFTTEDARFKVLSGEGCDPDEHSSAALASAHLDWTKDGYPRISMVIKPEATIATWAHECSHVADFVCSALGLPISLKATEVRAYLIGYLMSRLEDIFQEEPKKCDL